MDNSNETMITERMLSNAPSTVDIREGSILYDACKSVSIELMLLNNTIEWCFKNSFADTSEREFLIERAKERGLSPMLATSSVVKAQFKPTTINVPIGARFNSDNIIFSVIEKLVEGQYLLKSESTGIENNKRSGMLVAIDHQEGLQSAEIIELTIPGTDDEETEVFRKRYFDSFENQAYGGNISDYKQKMHAFKGVGGVKIYPVWNGGGTVKIVFSTSEHDAPKSEFVEKVQEYIDPVPYHQKGLGVAPIGHYVTVEGTTEQVVNIAFRLTLKPSVQYRDIESRIKTTIENYFKELNSQWEQTQIISASEFNNFGIIVRLAKIESIILDLPEVVDIEETTINNRRKNLELNVNSLVKLGVITNE